MTDVRSTPEPAPTISLHALSADPPVTRSRADHLRCTACGASTALELEVACPSCLGPLAVGYALSGLADRRPSDLLAGRPRSIWRFEELLPAVERSWVARFEVGGSPLRRAPRLAEKLGFDELFLKDETLLPTGSFKDRAAALAVARALDRGFHAVGCASTGNLAAATARSAALAGVPCLVFVPKGLPTAKIALAERYGARVVEVDGTYDDANRIAQLAGESGRIGLVNVTLRPYYSEGSKTLLYESVESLGWRTPDVVVAPLGSGALLSATDRARRELEQLGWSTGGGARLVGSQPDGCAPIADAFDEGSSSIRPVERPTTLAESLAIGDPASGEEALRAIRSSGGAADSPTEREVIAAIDDVARSEGVWVEPAGGTVIASVRRLRESGTLRRSERVVVYLTGAGWKARDLPGPDPSGPARRPLLDPRAPDVGARVSALLPSAGPREGRAVSPEVIAW